MDNEKRAEIVRFFDALLNHVLVGRLFYVNDLSVSADNALDTMSDLIDSVIREIEDENGTPGTLPNTPPLPNSEVD